MNPTQMPAIAALLARRQGMDGTQVAPSMPPQQQAAYYGSIPEIVKARQEDPRQLLANTALATGSSTAPVAGGGWAWADGIARALSGAAGGYINKQNDKKYAAREQDMLKALQQTAAMASTPQSQAAPPPPAVIQAAAALSPMPSAPTPAPSAFDQAFAPYADSPPAPPNLPAGGVGAAPASPMAYAPVSGARRPLSAPPMSGPTSPGRGPSANGGAPSNARELYFKGIVPIEGGTDPKTGKFRTSPKGAIGPGQVMPGTAPEAAKLAGVPFDDKRYRSDPEYNNLLGQAYYAKQLETFGDPVKAAAAYNAGPGRVQRAVRQAERKGGEWTSYLPAETRKYVVNFAEKIGDASATVSGNTVNENIEAVGAVPVSAPIMEGVPEFGQANYVPPEVESNRIAMAQQMLASGNPDLVVMARAYLDQGLSEQNNARMLRSEQQFGMGRDERGYQIGERRDAQQRNFGRENTFMDQNYNSAENAANREQQARLASADQSFTRIENERNRAFQASQADIERAERRAEIEAQVRSNPFFDTIGGRKLADDMYKEIDSNALAISKFDRMLQILDSGLQTGSMYAGLGSEEIQSRFGGINSDVGEFLALQNDTTLAKIGGSLGTAVSDGDRTFIANSNVNLGKDEQANRNVALATIGALERKNDYNYARMEAEMGGPEALKAFNKSWRAFAESESIVKYDRKGNVASVTRKPMRYEDWLAKRPRFDINGNRIN